MSGYFVALKPIGTTPRGRVQLVVVRWLAGPAATIHRRCRPFAHGHGSDSQ